MNERKGGRARGSHRMETNTKHRSYCRSIAMGAAKIKDGKLAMIIDSKLVPKKRGFGRRSASSREFLTSVVPNIPPKAIFIGDVSYTDEPRHIAARRRIG